MKLKHFILTCCTCCGLFAAEEPLSLSIFKEISAVQKGNVLYSPNVMEASLAPEFYPAVAALPEHGALPAVTAPESE